MENYPIISLLHRHGNRLEDQFKPAARLAPKE